MYLKFKNWGEPIIAKVGKLTIKNTMTVTTQLCDEPHVVGSEDFGKVLTVTGHDTDFDHIEAGTNLTQRFVFNANPTENIEWDTDAAFGFKYGNCSLQIPYEGSPNRNLAFSNVLSKPNPPYSVVDNYYIQDMRPFNLLAEFKNFRIMTGYRPGIGVNTCDASITEVTYLGTPQTGGTNVTYAGRWNRTRPWLTTESQAKSAAETFFCECEYDGEKYIGILFYKYDSWTDGYDWHTHTYTTTPNLDGFSFQGIPAKYFSDVDIATVDYGENSDADGGYGGTFDDTSADIEFTGDSADQFSNIISSSDGFHVYSVDNVQYNDIIKAFMDHNHSLSIFNKEPWESILGVYKIPFSVDLSALTYQVQANGYKMEDANHDPINAPIVAETLASKTVGTINISPYFDNFMDYSPYTSAQIYLPFIGFRDLPINDIMGGSVTVEYKCDVLSGNCAAYITGKNRFGKTDIIAIYTGNCAVQLPMYGARGNAGQILGALTGAAISAVMENPAGLVTSLAPIATMQNKPNVSSQYNGNAGILSNRQCYIIISRTVPSIPENFEQFRGYTLDVTQKIGDLSGYVEMEEVHVDIDAPAEDCEEIEKLLKQGVFV